MAEAQDQETSTVGNPPTGNAELTPIFRDARPEEDDVLSRILCNAFLPLWNHNWFHNVSRPLEPVSIGAVGSKAPPPHMTNLQKSRVLFYRSLIRLSRLIGGAVVVAEMPSSDNAVDSGDADSNVAAVLLWLPPSKRLGDFDLVTLSKSGFLNLVLPWHYGLKGFHRVQNIFEANVNSMLAKALPSLPPSGFKAEDCGFVQMLAINPKFKGKHCASALLKYQVERHFAEYPDRPVILDTTTKQGVKAYERLGFKLAGEKPVDTGTDAMGIRLASDASEDVRRQAKETCVQRVMVKLP